EPDMKQPQRTQRAQRKDGSAAFTPLYPASVLGEIMSTGVRAVKRTKVRAPALMAELFQTTPQNITLHLRAIYAERELSEAATCKDYLQVRSEGGRQIQRSLRHYNLEAMP